MFTVFGVELILFYISDFYFFVALIYFLFFIIANLKVVLVK